jgi:hypothetical protein
VAIIGFAKFIATRQRHRQDRTDTAARLPAGPIEARFPRS